MPEAGSVTLEIYNTAGQKVRTLLHGSLGVGFHSVSWDATNEFGQAVASGIYLYKIQAGSHVQVKKMVLLK